LRNRHFLQDLAALAHQMQWSEMSRPQGNPRNFKTAGNVLEFDGWLA